MNFNQNLIGLVNVSNILGPRAERALRRNRIGKMAVSQTFCAKEITFNHIWVWATVEFLTYN
jgi:hypothetical protein